MGNLSSQKLELILEAIGFCRALVIDSVEIELGDKPCWKFLRSRLLRAFGENGLENRVKDILKIEG